MGPDARLDPQPATLVTLCVEGDERAWRTLVDQYSPLVWTVTRSHRLSAADCQDVYQLTWMRTIQHLGTLRSPELFGSWLATTARRECLKYIERNRRHVPVGDSPILDEVTGHVPEQPEETAVRRSGHHGVRQAFRQLPQRDQALLRVLMAEPAPSYDEVSHLLGLPRGSIGPLRQRALVRLRNLLPRAA